MRAHTNEETGTRKQSPVGWILRCGGRPPRHCSANRLTAGDLGPGLSRSEGGQKEAPQAPFNYPAQIPPSMRWQNKSWLTQSWAWACNTRTCIDPLPSPDKYGVFNENVASSHYNTAPQAASAELHRLIHQEKRRFPGDVIAKRGCL